jgi:hypothetical protein
VLWCHVMCGTVDLLGLDPTPAPAVPSSVSSSAGSYGGGLDIFGGPVAAPALEVLGSKDGVTIRGGLSRSGGKVVLQTTLENGTGSVVGSVRHVSLWWLF